MKTRQFKTDVVEFSVNRKNARDILAAINSTINELNLIAEKLRNKIDYNNGKITYILRDNILTVLAIPEQVKLHFNKIK